jgi:hypothetical protein
VLATAVVLRVWGLKHGLPFAYNPDEQVHFVQVAVDFHRTGDLNPHYFANPPALTYVLYVVFALRYGGSAGVVERSTPQCHAITHVVARKIPKAATTYLTSLSPTSSKVRRRSSCQRRKAITAPDTTSWTAILTRRGTSER